MTKRLKALFLGLILSLSLFLSVNLTSFAEGTTTIYLSGSSVDVGDSVSVTVTGSESGSITVKYTSAILSLQSVSGADYSAEGNTVTFTGTTATLTFSTAAEGTANVIVSSDSLSGSSAAISVGSTASETTETTETTETAEEEEAAETEEAEVEETEEVEAEEESTTEEIDYDFMVDGTAYVVSERYSSSEIPAGFEKTSLTIHDSTYNELTNGVLTLVYLKPASDTSGSGTFYIYDADSDSVTAMELVGNMESYVILMTPDSYPTELLVSADLVIDEESYSAYVLDGTESSFYYIYGMNENQLTDWFTYDSETGEISRADTSALELVGVSDVESEEEAEEESVFSQLTKYRIIAVVIFVAAILLIILLNTVIFRKKGDDDEEDEEELVEKSSAKDSSSEDEEDDDDEDEKPRFSLFPFLREREVDVWAEEGDDYGEEEESVPEHRLTEEDIDSGISEHAAEEPAVLSGIELASRKMQAEEAPANSTILSQETVRLDSGFSDEELAAAREQAAMEAVAKDAALFGAEENEDVHLDPATEQELLAARNQFFNKKTESQESDSFEVDPGLIPDAREIYPDAPETIDDNLENNLTLAEEAQAVSESIAAQAAAGDEELPELQVMDFNDL